MKAPTASIKAGIHKRASLSVIERRRAVSWKRTYVGLEREWQLSRRLRT